MKGPRWPAPLKGTSWERWAESLIRILQPFGDQVAFTVRSVQNGLNVATMTADEVNDDATPNTLHDLPGLAFPVEEGAVYWYRAFIPYTAAATSTGSRWVTTGPSMTWVYIRAAYTVTGAVETINILSALNLPVACNATSGSTGANFATIEGVLRPSAGGIVQLRFASEVASSAITAKNGANIQWRRLD